MGENDPEIKLVLSKEFTGVCPNCESKNVEKGILSFGFRSGGSSNKYPEADTAVWHCLECKRIFHVKGCGGQVR